MELLSRLDYFNIGRRYVVTRAKRLNPREVDVEGSDINLVVGAASYMAYAVSLQNAERFEAHLLDGAQDEDLDRLLFDRYQMLRKGASAAITTVQFSRPTAAAGAGGYQIGTKLESLTGIEYLLTTPANFTASGLTTSADARAAQAGKAFQVGANQIRRFAPGSVNFDTTVTINNAEPAAGGEPVESNDIFRERGRNFWQAARRGTLGAIEFGANEVPGVESASAVEVIHDGNPARFVNLYVADSSGVSSAALAVRVSDALGEYRAAGIYVAISTSRPQIVEVVFKPTFVAGVNTVALTEQIRRALFEFINTLNVNQPLHRNDLGAVLSRFRQDGLVTNQTTIIEPVGDLIPSPGFTLRTRLENVLVQV